MKTIVFYHSADFDGICSGQIARRALNIARSNSMVFAAAIRPDHDGCLSYYYDGAKWRFSLYSVPGKEYDFSVIAKKYGGGGHRGASGFTLPALPKSLGGNL